MDHYLQLSSVAKLKGENLFRDGIKVYCNRSDELTEYNGVLHSHDFIEICYVISGHGYHRLQDQTYKTSSGDLFVINGNIPHGFFPQENGNDFPLIYNCAFTTEFLDHTLFDSADISSLIHSALFEWAAPKDMKASPYISFQGTHYNEIGEIFERMHKEYRFMKKGYPDIIRAYLIELLVKIFRFMDETLALEDKFFNVSEKQRQMIEKAIAYIRQNFVEEITLPTLSKLCHVSRSHFSRMFKVTTGMNFIDYLLKLRVEEACRLLRTTSLNVTEIANSSGFKDMKHFYQVFKREIKMTPKQYRDSKF